MINPLRQKFNQEFTEERYQEMLAWIGAQYNYSPTFHVAETPVFIPNEVRDRILRACEDIMEVVVRPNFMELTSAAIPPGEFVPKPNAHPLFMQFDFGLCLDESGAVSPQLIEAQGFPSLYFFQYLLNRAYRKFYDLPEDHHCRFNARDDAEYMDLLAQAILGKYAPENVVLLEVDPEKQNTRVDFLICQRELGIAELCISDVELDGNKLYYQRDGVRTRIHRIFNRVIFDELNARPDLKRSFNMIEDVDVEWAGHPNWFFLLSKFTLPFIDSPYVPKTHFLHKMEALPADLSAYVLKPLYSFAGAGVDLYPTVEKIRAIEKPAHYILQKKVQYADLVETLDVPARAEIRMMYVWPEDAPEPILLNNLVRLSKGEMVGVKYNKDKTWVGGSLGYFAP
ncbi:MAG: hypothetical protein AAGF89_10010 [Bacteroidota bacterium]